MASDTLAVTCSVSQSLSPFGYLLAGRTKSPASFLYSVPGIDRKWASSGAARLSATVIVIFTSDLLQTVLVRGQDRGRPRGVRTYRRVRQLATRCRRTGSRGRPERPGSPAGSPRRPASLSW